MNAPLLIELLTEELPPKSLAALGEAFANGVFKALERHHLIADQSGSRYFATPRRLAVLIDEVRARADSQRVREKILPSAIAFDAQGLPSAPLKKKLAALGLDADSFDLQSLERVHDGKQETLFLSRDMPGAALAEIMTDVLGSVIAALPIAKLMSYQIDIGSAKERTVFFARPAHGLVVLHGSSVVAAEALGLAADRYTLGHRFLCEGPVTIEHANDYEKALHAAFVLASFATRQTAISAGLAAAAKGATVLAPQALLDEVTALVEWPVVYRAQFDPAFLRVPQECLILTMQQNQKYFALTDGNGVMQPEFLLVSNLFADDPSLIVHGNERVLRARLADAKFFFEQDKKRTLASRLPALAHIVYFKKLGTLAERSQRVEILARELAVACGADLDQVSRAAALAKADLTTDMVGEFPELQGVMGRYYALHDGELAVVADAIAEHYKPRYATDTLPSSTVGVCVALADKLETLAGLFAVGEVPTGERDPFALRRHALGVLRMLYDHRVELDLKEWLTRAVGLFAARIDGPRDVPSVVVELEQFVFERLRSLLREKGYQATEIEAVLSLRPQRIDQVAAVLDAVRAFARLPEAPSLAAANKRIANILKKNPDVPGLLRSELYAEDAERSLGAALESVLPDANAAFESGDYTMMLQRLATLRDPVDQFFADVMVMAEDPALRGNRLALLTKLHRSMNRIADLSKLAAL